MASYTMINDVNISSEKNVNMWSVINEHNVHTCVVYNATVYRPMKIEISIKKWSYVYVCAYCNTHHINGIYR